MNCPICDKPKDPHFKCCSKKCKAEYDIQRQQDEERKAEIHQQAADRFLLNKRIEA